MERHPISDSRLLLLGRLQNLCMFCYYPLEHIWWLSSHDIVPLSKDSQNKASLLSSRLWMAYVSLYFLHLGIEWRILRARERSLRKDFVSATTSTVGDLADDLERSVSRLKGERGMWRLNFCELAQVLLPKCCCEANPSVAFDSGMNLAYFPLTIHWSFPQLNLLNEGQVALCGTLAGLLQLRKAWKGTAL